MTKPFALIIEDDPQLSQIFSLALMGLFETEIVMDGKTALARLSEITPDVIILDLNLPEVNGEQILAYIRETSRLEKIPVIIATADARQADYLQDSVEIVLIKPVSPVQLRELAVRLQAQTG